MNKENIPQNEETRQDMLAANKKAVELMLTSQDTNITDVGLRRAAEMADAGQLQPQDVLLNAAAAAMRGTYRPQGPRG